MFDPILKGWHQYYGRFYGIGNVDDLGKHVNAYLVRWPMRKYKRLARHKLRARRALGRLAQQKFPRARILSIGDWDMRQWLDDGSRMI